MTRPIENPSTTAIADSPNDSATEQELFPKRNEYSEVELIGHCAITGSSTYI